MHLDLIFNFFTENALKLGLWMYPLVGLVSLLESAPIIGIALPGTFIMVLFGYLISQGVMSFWTAVLIAVVGGIFGDVLGYYMGRFGKKFFTTHGKILKAAHIQTGTQFFERHGTKSVFIGRFINITRPVVPIVAGLVDMDFKRFMYWNVSGALLWVLALMGGGYFFGFSIDRIEGIATKLSFGALCVLAVLVGGYFAKERAKSL